MKTKNTAFKGIILFLLILLCIGAAYAADDTITDNPNLNDASLSLAETSVSQSDSSNSALSQDQDENVIETNSESNLASNEIGEGRNIYVKNDTKDGDGSEEKPFGDLKSAISIASDGDTIIVANGTYSGVNNSNLSISQSGLTIKAAEGASPSITGSSARRIFSLTGLNIVLQGLFLTSGRINSNYGGGVLIASDGVTIKNCTFYNCKAFYGGAVFISGNNVVIDDCEFRGNTALDNKLTLGGAIYISRGLSNILINNSRFGVNGYNRADCGGAIFSSSSAVFNNTIFSNNIADDIGGALYVTNAASESIFENCIFNNNAAYGRYTAVTGGGAMAIYGTGNKIINSNFTKNWVTDCGGALMMFRSNNEIINTSFEDNKAGRGGAICLRFVSNDINENNRIIGCNFTGNGKPFSHSTEVLTKGGAIFSYANKTYILDSKFEDNVALSGGAVLFGCDANGNRANDNTIENSTFKNNQAVRYGGGAISSASKGDKILNSTFISNTAKNYGGALSMDYVDVYNSTFTDNMAIEGTAIYAIETYVEGSDFSSNIADNGKGYQKSHLMSSSLQESGEGKVIVGLNKAEVKDSNINEDDVVSMGISTIHQTDYTESLITTDNNYIGYCAEELCDQSMDGVILENLSIFRNSLDSSNVADYLKVLVWEYFKGTSDEDSLQKQVTIFTDGDYLNSEDPIVKDVIAKVNSGMRIASENAIKILEDGKIIAYNFKALVTPQATQNVFIFNLSEVNETVVKETLTPVVVKGEEAKFNITVTNNGENNITGVFINDSDFDPQLIYSSFESDSEDYDWTYNESSKIWILNKTLEPGQSASIIISFETTESGEFRNNVSSGLGNHTFSNSSNVTKVISPNMTIEKISNNQTVEVGEKVSFTITVKNTGDCNLTGVYVVDDDYNRTGLQYVGYENSTDYKWNYTDGKWFYDGVLEPGQSANFTVNFTVIGTGVLVNNVTAGSNESNETNGTNNTTAYAPNMTVQKITVDNVTYVGNNTSFIIVVTNTGDCNLTGVYVVDDDYDHNGLQYVGYENSTDYKWNYTGGKWFYDGVLEPGDSANFTVNFTVIGTGVLVNNVTAGSNESNETNGTNNTTAYAPNMTIEKISNNQTVEVGEKVSFTITVKNTGDCNLTGVYITDKDYSDGLTYDSFVDSSGKWSFDGKDTWNYDGELEVGESASIEIIFVASTAGEKVNTAIAGNNITNETVNSTNTTNVTEVPEENTTNDTVVVPEEIPDDVHKETLKKTVKVANATGNPLFVLVAVLVILFGMPLRRRK